MPAEVIGAAAILITAAGTAYGAYNADAAARADKAQREAILKAIGVRTDAEKKLLELQVNQGEQKFFNQTAQSAQTVVGAATQTQGAVTVPAAATTARSLNVQSLFDSPMLLIGGVLVTIVGFKALRK